MNTEKITYYSTPSQIFDTNIDVIKGTSLTPYEIDNNFNTLEGRLIKNIAMSEDGSSMQINLLNGNTLTCDNIISKAITAIDFIYDAGNDILSFYVNNDKTTAKNINGLATIETVTKMISENNVFTDNSLNGNGSISNPLRIARTEKTGVYKPITDIVDELPDNPNVGDRYVINSKIDKNGSLYNYDGVMHIIQYLEHENSEWHVARKSDWDDMLNALEPNTIDRTHCSKHTPEWLGENAGAYLAKDDYGFNVTYCGYATEEEEKHIAWGNKREIWWTASNERGRSAYVKRVDRVNNAVYQDIIDGDQFFSVRLVRDMNPNENYGAETIMGTDYQVVAMPSVQNGLRLWINVNFGSTLLDITHNEQYTETEDKCGKTDSTTITETVIDLDGYDKYNRFRPDEWEMEDITYVCEYDGTRWIKQPINAYDTFYVIAKNEFYILENSKLSPTHKSSPTYSDIEVLSDAISYLKKQVDALLITTDRFSSLDLKKLTVLLSDGTQKEIFALVPWEAIAQ